MVNNEERRILDALSRSRHIDLRWLEREEKQGIRQTLERLYWSEKMSTTEIGAGIGKSAYFVWSLCRRLGIELRSPDEGKAIAAPRRVKTLRRRFSGSEKEKCYLQGFAEGDLDVRKPSTNAVMVSSTTTHPSFAQCFRKLFQQYGPVYHYPIFDEIVGYRWKVAARLDNSFSFLLPSSRRSYPTFAGGPDLFYSWLAGIVDTDGSVHVVPSGKYVKLLLVVSNQDPHLLAHIKNELLLAGGHPTGPYLRAAGGYSTKSLNIRYNDNMWSLYLQRSGEVKRNLKMLPLRHKEKILRKELALGVSPGAHWTDVETKVRALQNYISRSVSAYVAYAEVAHKKRGLGQASELPSPVSRQLRTS